MLPWMMVAVLAPQPGGTARDLGLKHSKLKLYHIFKYVLTFCNYYYYSQYYDMTEKICLCLFMGLLPLILLALTTQHPECKLSLQRNIQHLNPTWRQAPLVPNSHEGS
jgi:hypothetical protein